MELYCSCSPDSDCGHEPVRKVWVWAEKHTAERWEGPFATRQDALDHANEQHAETCRVGPTRAESCDESCDEATCPQRGFIAEATLAWVKKHVSGNFFIVDGKIEPGCG